MGCPILRRRPMRRSGIGLALFALVAASCGQYPGVHERAVAEGEIPASQTGLAPATGVASTGTAPGTAEGAGGPTGVQPPAGSAPGTTGGSTEVAAGGTGSTGEAAGTGAEA